MKQGFINACFSFGGSTFVGSDPSPMGASINQKMDGLLCRTEFNFSFIVNFPMVRDKSLGSFVSGSVSSSARYDIFFLFGLNKCLVVARGLFCSKLD